MGRRTKVQGRLGQALVEGAFINREQLKSAQKISHDSGKKLREVLIEQHLVSPETLATVLSFQLNVPVIELKQFRVQPEALRLIPEEIARERNALPLSVEGDTLRMAMEDPQDLELIDTLAALTQMRIRPVLPLRGGLSEAIDSNYKPAAELAEELVEATPPSPEQPLPELKSDFLLTLAHELKTPLTSLKSSASLLVEEVNNLINPSLSRLANLIERSTERLDGLVSKLLYMARAEKTGLEISSTPYDIAEVIQAEVAQMAPLIKSKGQHLEIDLPSGVMATIPPDRFKEILNNLLSNAYRFTPEGGRISVALRKGQNRFTVEVSDTGIGIPEEEQGRIFDMLYQCKGTRLQAIAGDGLGLSIAKQIVEMYGGKIWVTSTVGKGSTFYFSSPVVTS